MFDRIGSMDWVFNDPPFIDLEFPADHLSFRFMTGSEPVYGHIWVAQGKEPKGTVVIVPQLFGGDRLESVTFPLLQSGINVISFIPRGIWDRSQIYSLPGAVEDVHSLIAYIRSCDYDPASAMGALRRRLDPGRIALFGLSGGGGTVGFTACAESPFVSHAIAVAPSNMETMSPSKAAELDPAIVKQTKDIFDEIGRPELWEILAAMAPEQCDRLSIIKQANKLVEKQLLLIGASRDVVAPLEIAHYPIAQALMDAGARDLTAIIIDSDHMLMSRRNALARLVISWLQNRGF